MRAVLVPPMGKVTVIGEGLKNTFFFVAQDYFEREDSKECYGEYAECLRVDHIAYKFCVGFIHVGSNGGSTHIQARVVVRPGIF